MTTYIIYFSEAYTGGREVARNLAQHLQLVPITFRNNLSQRKIVKFYDIISGLFYCIFKVVAAKRTDTIILEGCIPSYLAMVRLFKRVNITTRVGRVYTMKDSFIFFLPHLFANNIVCPSNIAMERLQRDKLYKLFGIPRKCRVVPNPVSRLHQQNNQIHKRKKTNGLRLLIIGRSVPEKRLTLSLKIACAISTHNINQTTVSLITNANGAEFEKYVKPFNNRFRMLQPTNDMQSIYQNHDLLINSAINEGFSMISFEAMCYGIPTLSFEGVSAQNEYIKEGILNGYIIKDVSDITRDFVSALNNKSFERTHIDTVITDLMFAYAPYN